MATSNGLNRYEGGRIDRWTGDDGLPSNSLLSLWAEPDGRLWVGTYGSGLALLDASGTIVPTGAPTLPSQHVRSLLRASDGALWIGTIRGALRWAGDETRTFTTDDGLRRDFVSLLAEDSRGGIWIGGLGALARWQAGELERVDRLPGYGDAQPFAFVETADGRVWFASDRGLLRYEGDRFTVVGRAEGLPDDTLFGAAVDETGHLWLSSNGGLLRVSMADVERAADGALEAVAAERFTEDHGMASRQGNGGSTPALARSSDGRIWVATALGAAVVDPLEIQNRLLATPPRTVQVEAILIDGAPVSLTDPVRITPGTRHLEFHFAGLRLSGPASLRYRYRLVGYDADWREAGSGRIAHYTNLDPGPYRFEVMAGSGDEWRTAEDPVQLLIEPFFYETRWFYVLLATTLAAVLWGGFRLRMASLRSRASRLAVEVAQRTADLQERTDELERVADERSRLLVELEEQSRAFERQAREDALTGLPNRRRFDERFRDAFATVTDENGQLSVALADLDRFKRINDEFSHQVGDEVLRRVGELLADWARELVGVSVARYGGEEFALLFVGYGPEEVMAGCEELRRRIANQDWEAVAPGLVVTLSMGVSTDADVKTHERMLVQADHALYAAKAAGRDRVHGATDPAGV